MPDWNGAGSQGQGYSNAHAEPAQFFQISKVWCSICHWVHDFDRFPPQIARFHPLGGINGRKAGAIGVLGLVLRLMCPMYWVIGTYWYLWPTGVATLLRFTQAGSYRQVITGRGGDRHAWICLTLHNLFLVWCWVRRPLGRRTPSCPPLTLLNFLPFVNKIFSNPHI